jgi:hypothetical protein
LYDFTPAAKQGKIQASSWRITRALQEEHMPTAVPIPRPEHPRPDFVRNTFYNLNGTWQFAFDDDDRGLAERWQDGRQLPLSIVVPFCYQSEKSGLGGDEIHPILWYRRAFSVPEGHAGASASCCALARWTMPAMCIYQRQACGHACGRIQPIALLDITRRAAGRRQRPVPARGQTGPTARRRAASNIGSAG